MTTTIAVFQLKHLISKASGLEMLEMWSTIFVFSKLTEIFENLHKCQFCEDYIFTDTLGYKYITVQII